MLLAAISIFCYCNNTIKISEKNIKNELIGVWEHFPHYKESYGFSNYKSDGTYHSFFKLYWSEDTIGLKNKGKWSVKDNKIISTTLYSNRWDIIKDTIIIVEVTRLEKDKINFKNEGLIELWAERRDSTVFNKIEFIK